MGCIDDWSILHLLVVTHVRAAMTGAAFLACYLQCIWRLRAVSNASGGWQGRLLWPCTCCQHWMQHVDELLCTHEREVMTSA